MSRGGRDIFFSFFLLLLCGRTRFRVLLQKVELLKSSELLDLLKLLDLLDLLRGEGLGSWLSPKRSLVRILLLLGLELEL